MHCVGECVLNLPAAVPVCLHVSGTRVLAGHAFALHVFGLHVHRHMLCSYHTRTCSTTAVKVVHAAVVTKHNSHPIGHLLLTSAEKVPRGCADATWRCCCHMARVKSCSTCHGSHGWGRDRLHSTARHKTARLNTINTGMAGLTRDLLSCSVL
jgi:hypothetical protein